MVAGLTERINVGPLCPCPSGYCLSGPLCIVCIGMACLGSACSGVAPVSTAPLSMARQGMACR